ncbi:Hachiman antiphage defense system protein HamA [Sutcliffiella horikoshii]|uniref:Hachiman antiphage defense system protein HamA n=1 Tax=Sutcliffiella horikoshii TaxID=79883 RepID=UPI001CFEA056|nr:Hachiman antiphage defense system protein HamA [Sutcliffiella horikoshii]
MSDFLCHFSSEEKDSYLILKLDDEMKLLGKLPDYYRKCYIHDHNLEERIKKFELPAEKILENFIPDPGKTMSGEFSEILTYQLIIDMYKEIDLFGPKKWLWKVDRNEPMKKTDVILFGFENEGTVSHEDLVVSAEIKSKATEGEFHPLQDAINGSKDDYVKRMAITLSWLEEQYIRINDLDAKKSIQRFINSIDPEYGPFKKHFKAMAVIDSGIVQNELNREIDLSVKMYKKDWKKIQKECEGFGASYDDTSRKLSFNNVKREEIVQSDCKQKNEILYLYDLYHFNLMDYSDVTIISIENLKGIYEGTYKKILTSYMEA